MAVADGAGPSISPIFSGYTYHVASSFPPTRIAELEHILNANGATQSSDKNLKDVNVVITNSMRFEGWENVDQKAGVLIVTDKWVERSVVLRKPQPGQFYSANPSMIFSGITATSTGLPLADQEVLSAGITALGGQWRAGLNKDVTHLFAIAPGSQKYETALASLAQGTTKIKILLPHWFDDAVRLGAGNLVTKVYEWPDPLFLKGHHGIRLTKEKKAQNEGDELKRTLYATAAKYTQANDSDEPPSIDANHIPPTYPNVWQGRKFVLSRTLQLYGSRREAVQIGIERAGGVVIRFDGDDEAEEPGITLPNGQEKMSRWEKERRRKEADRIPDCDVLVTRWRHGSSYRNALREHKAIGTLSWLFHVQSTGIFSRPTDQLLHYPIPKTPVENFSAHVITLTNYTGEAREYLKKLISAMGASFTPSMSANNTALIAAYVDGTKSSKAQSWSIPVVNHTWLEDCFVQWRNLTPALEKYIVFPPGVNFASLLGERGIGSGFAVEDGTMEAKWLEELESIQFSEDEPDEEYVDMVAEVKGSDSEEEAEMMMPLGTEASMKEVAGLVGLNGSSPLKGTTQSSTKPFGSPMQVDSASATPRKRGRPRGSTSRARSASRGRAASASASPTKTPTRGRGRPRKSSTSRPPSVARSVSRPRGRPPGSKNRVSGKEKEKDLDGDAREKPKSKANPKAASAAPVTPLRRGRSQSRARAQAQASRPPSPTASVESVSKEKESDSHRIAPTSGRKLVRRVTVELEKRNPPLESQVSNTPAKAPPKGDSDSDGGEGNSPVKGTTAGAGPTTPSILDKAAAKADARTRVVKKKRDSGGKPVEEDSDEVEERERRLERQREKAKEKEREKERERELEEKKKKQAQKQRAKQVEEPETPKRGRGRPRKNVIASQPGSEEDDEDGEDRVKEQDVSPTKRGPGRPRKNVAEDEESDAVQAPKRPRGRPRKDASQSRVSSPESEEEMEVSKKPGRRQEEPISLTPAASGSPVKTYGRRGRKDRYAQDDNEEDSSLSEEDDQPPPRKSAKSVPVAKAESSKKVQPLESSDSEEDEVAQLVTDQPKAKAGAGTRKKPLKVLQVSDEEEDDDDDDDFPPPAKALFGKASSSPKKPSAADVPVVSSSKKPTAAVPRTPTRTVSVLVPDIGLSTRKVLVEKSDKGKSKDLSTDKGQKKMTAPPSKSGKGRAAQETTDEEEEDQSRPTSKPDKKKPTKLAPAQSLQAISGQQPSAVASSTPSSSVQKKNRPPPSPPVSHAGSEAISVAGSSYPRRGAAAKAQASLRSQAQDIIKFEQQMRHSRKSGGGMSSFGFEGDGAKSKAQNKPSAGKKRGSSEMEEEEEEGEQEVEEVEEPKKKKRRVSGEKPASSAPPVAVSKQGKRKASEIAPDEGESNSKKPKSTKGPAKKPEEEIYLMTTQVTLSDDVVKTLTKLGVKMATRPSQCTHLIAAAVVRTEKFLCALAVAPFILSAEWAIQSAARKELLPEKDFILKDEKSEERYQVQVAELLERAKSVKGKLFQGHTFYVTNKTPVDRKLLKNVIQAFGGEMSTNTPTIRIINSDPEHRHVISVAADLSIWRAIHAQDHKIRTHEFLLNSALRQELEWDNDEYLLEP